MPNQRNAGASWMPNDPKVGSTLDRLHNESKHDRIVIMQAFPTGLLALIRGRSWFEAVSPWLKYTYVKVGYEAGELMYTTARAINARRIIEFGTGFGFSTIYLAAAVRDNGGGTVITTEIEPTKAQVARRNLADAGLEHFVEIRTGDAMETLRGAPAPVDMVLLDGWNEAYIPLVKMLTPTLRHGSVVFADNVKFFKNALRPYVEHMRNPQNGFVTTTLNAGSGFEYSVYLPTNGR
ncbi:MAG: methyltransferase [Alphaproteobacteria bacterium]|nr:methyltransferase [Alphaproteobacteria bacterium]